MSKTTAQFIGVGVGPGDPELITVKAWRLIQRADVITYLTNNRGQSQAKTIAHEALSEVNKEQKEIPVLIPAFEDRELTNRAYDEAASAIQEELNKGKQVVFLCEGDPLFFGSFAYLLDRLAERNDCRIIPGITSVNAASSALRLPLTMLRESLAVTSGRHSDVQLIDTLNTYDSVVIMKAGQSRQRILKALAVSNRSHEAKYIEYIGRENERIVSDMAQLENEAGPYFSLFVVTKTERDRT